MARSRFDNLDEGRQEEIIRIAGQEFAAKGYERASLNEIIDEAGISKGSLYYYFENKEDLFSTVVESVTTGEFAPELFDFSVEELTRGTFWEELEQIVREAARYASRHRWQMRLVRVYYDKREGEAGSVRTSELYAMSRRWTERLVDHGQQLGVVRTDAPREFLVEMATGVAEAGDRWFLEHFEEFDEIDFEREAERQIDMFRRVLKPRE